jgi:uncharacterized SAM-binding protein YcdF (DUF218 family)
MVLFLSKLLALIFYPVGCSCLLALCALAFLLLRKKKTAFFCVFFSITILFFFSTPFVSYFLIRSLENKYNQAAYYPRVSAIVLLGGCTRPAIPPRKYVEISEGGNRILHTVRLYKAHYAPVIICTGGKIPFLHDFPGSEARSMSELLVELMGIDSSAIIIEDKAQNTHDHGPKIKEICENRGVKKDIILVTSAMHMHRSVKVFRKYGFTVYPAPTDFWAEKKTQWNVFSFLPESGALNGSTAALHEYYGLMAYTIMGWL